MTPSEILQLNANDIAIDIINTASATYSIDDNNKLENKDLDSSNKESEETIVHTKREHEKDEQSTKPSKRAGRKPLDTSQIPNAPLDPKQKRKAQNRAAQRAFRDRKEKYVTELQARIEELEALTATKDEELVKENKRLKDTLFQLQKENEALKNAQFTFEFPIANNIGKDSVKIDNLYHLNSASSISEDASSSAEQSPLSNSHHHEDDSTNSDTPITNNTTLFPMDPLQFGLVQPNSLDFLAVADNSLTKNDTIPTGELFHGKDNLFTNYRLPNNDTAINDFLSANDDLSTLFGTTDDLFGFNTNLNAQFGLPETPATHKHQIPAEKKLEIVEKLKQAQQEGKYVYQGYQDIQQSCPDFDLDLLCNELKKKAQCSMGTYPITDQEVNALMHCLDKN